MIHLSQPERDDGASGPGQARARNLLVVDDDPVLCEVIKHFFEGKGFNVLGAATGAEGVRMCSEHCVDLALVDQKLPDGPGAVVCERVLAENEATKVIAITAHPSFANVRQAIQAGAHDYLTKPFELDELDLAIRRALRVQELERMELLNDYREARNDGSPTLIGCSPALRHLIDAAAASTAPVLITGETGSGKSVLAQSIHARSPRARAPFLAVNCAALPASLIEAELFGFDKGAFTGASSARKGLFELAEGGTLFLDEIAEMQSEMQAKLLGALEDGRIRRIGGAAMRRTDVRIMAATHADVNAGAGLSRLRKDLFYRVSVIRIHVPRLCDRRDEIPALCQHLLEQLTPDRTLTIAPHEMARLQGYAWPGNIRELKNVLERAVLLRKGPSLVPSVFLDASAPEQPATPRATTPVVPLRQVEDEHIRQTLNRLGGNLARTAAALGISLSTLQRRVKSFARAGSGQGGSSRSG